MKTPIRKFCVAAATASLLLGSASSYASSHMDAPLITLDPAANTTDVYAFVTGQGDNKKLVVALGVYPFEEPGIGPNKYNFDDNVRYKLHVALGDDVGKGQASMTYQFDFKTRFKNENTILQSYLGPIFEVDDANQNLTQTYTVTMLKGRSGKKERLGDGIVPPNNQGNATPFYNRFDNGENPAKQGVASPDQLDRYTQATIMDLKRGYRSFAGQRDDGFFADIQAVFDLLKLRSLDPAEQPEDSQGGFNLHLIALEIPLQELGGDQQVAGVYATTERRQIRVLRQQGDNNRGLFVQVARQGNPLFNEGFVAIVDKDRYSRSNPSSDRKLFLKYAETPELAALINALVIPGSGLNPAQETGRSDIAAIYIPDLIKVDLSTAAARLAGGGPNHATTPDDEGFSSLSVFGGDVLTSTVQAGLPGFPQGTIAGGWPNGRRFGDDVLDIAVTAAISTLPPLPLEVQGPVGDGVDQNDRVFNKVFPYESTPQNGRNHVHPGEDF